MARVARLPRSLVAPAAVYALPGDIPHGERGEVVVAGGDWDLDARPVAAIARARRSGGAGPRRAAIPVAVGRHGDVLVGTRHCRLASDAAASLTVVARHEEWDRFRASLLRFIAGDPDMDGLAYAPLPHVDLRDIPSWTGHDRGLAVIRRMSKTTRTVLDLGANLGYMSTLVERTGRTVVAVERDARTFWFLEALRRAQQCRFETIQADALHAVRSGRTADCVLALALFHHCIKTEAGHASLVDLLGRLRTREMFLWAHAAGEAQMRGAFRNYSGDDFPRFIILSSCLRAFERVGTYSGRTLYRLWR